jgi:hypothetical protein
VAVTAMVRLADGPGPDGRDWTSDLALDIDCIVEWICGVGGGGQCRVAPATLVFHGVTDLKIDIDWGRSVFKSRCIRRRSAMWSAN